MQKSLNRVELRGHVGHDPKVTKMENGGVLVRFNLATNEVYKDREGKYCENTVWHSVTAWSIKGMPDFEKIKKGVYLEVTGKIKYAKYTNKEGEEKNITEIVALKIIVPLAE